MKKLTLFFAPFFVLFFLNGNVFSQTEKQFHFGIMEDRRVLEFTLNNGEKAKVHNPGHWTRNCEKQPYKECKEKFYSTDDALIIQYICNSGDDSVGCLFRLQSVSSQVLYEEIGGNERVKENWIESQAPVFEIIHLGTSGFSVKPTPTPQSVEEKKEKSVVSERPKLAQILFTSWEIFKTMERKEQLFM